MPQVDLIGILELLCRGHGGGVEWLHLLRIGHLRKTGIDIEEIDIGRDKRGGKSGSAVRTGGDGRRTEQAAQQDSRHRDNEDGRRAGERRETDEQRLRRPGGGVLQEGLGMIGDTLGIPAAELLE